tara:strand:+ start:1269 stop:1526 length:258 start_codon:yes stop_codon:yes gene_type:complete
MSKPFNRQSVIKEFLGKIIRAIGKRKGSAAAKQIMKSPEMKKIVKKSIELADEFEAKLRKQAKEDPEFYQSVLDDYLKRKKDRGL